MPLYDCQIPGCDNSVTIRSKVKSGEFKGLLACGYCKRRHDGSGIKKSTEKSKEKRKAERSGLPLFFDNAIKDMTSRPICENCGARIKFWVTPTHNVAHILSKSRYKSVMSDPQNYVILCADKDQADNCHERFDNKVNERVNMRVFNTARNKYLSFSDKCLENGIEKIIFDTWKEK